MAENWERRRILIWGKTRPELSTTYREIVCTGGIFADTRTLVRLYPIPLRYMDDARVFKKYQWIEAYVAKSSNDPRPESYRIRSDKIEVKEHIPPKAGNWDEGAPWILNERTIFRSVEALQLKQAENRTSLGLIKPAAIQRVRSTRVPKGEKDAFSQRYDELMKQMELPLDPDTGREIRPLRAPDFRFTIEFQCNEAACKGHTFSILDWEVDALYFTCRQRSDAADVAASKVVAKLQDETDLAGKDLYLFLGNISTHPHIFTIVGLWHPKLKKRRPPPMPDFFSK